MDKVIPERLAKTRQTQVERYGGEEGYRAEMRRRRSLVTAKTGFAMMSYDKVQKAQLNSVKARKNNAKNRTKAENLAQEDNQPKVY